MIRFATEADVNAMLEIYAPYVLHTTATFEYTVPSREAFLERFRQTSARFPWLVWEENQCVLGYAYGSLPFRRAAYAWCAEASIYLRRDVLHRGIGSRLYPALEMCLKLQGYQVIYAVITGENTRSVSFHEKQGYSLTATFPDCGFKFNRWLSVKWMEKRLFSDILPMVSPVNWSDIVVSDEKIADILDKFTLF